MGTSMKIPAFTLMEVTIAMLIAGIAIAITFTTYRIVSGSYIGFSKKQNELAEFTRLDKLLKKDFMNARSIVKSPGGLMVAFEQGVISYQIDKDFVLRNQFSIRTDTFSLKMDKTSFLFEKDEVADGQAIDQFGFEAVVQGQVIPLSYRKIYSAQNLFK